MNIAIVVDDYHGGAGNIAQLLALELNKEHTVSIIFTCLCSEPRYCLKDICVYDEPLSVVGKNKLFGLFSSIKRVGNLLTNVIQAELVISFLDNNNSMVCLSQLTTKIPIIVAERSNPIAIQPKYPWNMIRRIAYQRANVVTIQFDAFRTFDRNRFSDKCMVTANIVGKSDKIKEYWESERIRFVTFGRLADIKRMDLMIHLFVKAKTELEDAELHIYGEGPNKEALKKMIEIENLTDCVKLMGYTNNVHETLLQYDIYLMTSLQEGFPNSLCEAMAVGLPSVSFRCHDGIFELTENDTCGYSVHEANEEGFIEKMVFLAKHSDKRMEMGRRAQQIVHKYSVETIMGQWKDCMREAMRR